MSAWRNTVNSYSGYVCLVFLLLCVWYTDVFVVTALPQADWGFGKQHESSMNTLSTSLYLDGAQGGLKVIVKLVFTVND